MQLKVLINQIFALPLPLFVVLALTLGLAPFAPPHLFEKIIMLIQGKLTRPLDWFDLLYHLTPWLLLGGKLYFMAITRSQGGGT